MINGTQITIVGNVGGDPELRFTPSGAAVVTFSVAQTPRRYDKTTNKWTEGAPTWFRVNAWRDLAEHIAETLTKGQRVIVVGTISAREWKDDKGETRIAWEVLADAVGPDLQYATAKVSRVARRDGNPPPPEDPWGGSTTAAPGNGSGAGYSDEPPF